MKGRWQRAIPPEVREYQDRLIVQLRDEHEMSWVAIGERLQLHHTSVAERYRNQKRRGAATTAE